MKLIFTTILTLIVINLSFSQNARPEFTHLAFMQQDYAYTAKQPRVTMEVGRLEVMDEMKIFIPKSFSPNADGINDVFRIHSENIAVFEMSVFNQWGEFLFTTNDPLLAWDGTLYNEEVRKGAYVYVIKLKTMNGQSKKYSGCLMIEQ